MRISFWGTPDISAILLQHLEILPEFDIVYTVTQTDKPRSERGRQVMPSPVKKKSLELKIPVLEPFSLKQEKNKLLEFMNNHKVDLHVILAYGKIIPREIFQCAEFGSVNFHASLLPLLRGASPIESALISGFSNTGWTLQKLEARLDAGDIISTAEISIGRNDTRDILYEKMTNRLLSFAPVSLLSYINGDVKLSTQNHELATYCGKLTPEMGKIDFALPAEKIRNLARAFSERPGVFTFRKNRKLKLFIDFEAGFHLSGDPSDAGKLIKIDSHLWFQCSPGIIPVSHVQLEGKKKMDIRSFCNGYDISENEKFPN